MNPISPWVWPILLNPEGSKIRSRGLNGVPPCGTNDTPGVSFRGGEHPGGVPEPFRYLEHAAALACLRHALHFFADPGVSLALNPRL